MRYSFVDGHKVQAFSGGKGFCHYCGQPTIAKYGQIKLHWAHKSLESCDNWWEKETIWHRNWKMQFPEAWQEVIHFDEVTGEKHVADIKTPNGVVIELQNSPIAIEELIARESFYKKMVWVVNAANFKEQFTLLQRLPDPKAAFMKDIDFIWQKAYPISRFVRPSNGMIYPVQEIQAEIDLHYVGHHFFHWSNRRKGWYQARCGVFLDFGGTDLFRLVKYDLQGWYAVKKIDKEYFINRALGREA